MWKWDYDPDDLPALSEILIDGQGKKVLSIGGDAVEGFYLKVTTEENKKLIAAAPDMCEALGKALKELEDWHDVPCNGCSTCIDIIPMIKAALRKAEGRP